jgi:phenylpyruvate tautomerase PptA (4-oxalocrotonate tautomerase family)
MVMVDHSRDSVVVVVVKEIDYDDWIPMTEK